MRAQQQPKSSTARVEISEEKGEGPLANRQARETQHVRRPNVSQSVPRILH